MLTMRITTTIISHMLPRLPLVVHLATAVVGYITSIKSTLLETQLHPLLHSNTM